MVFTKKHINFMKSHLWLAMLAFVVQLGLPQVTLAAEADYQQAKSQAEPLMVNTIDNFINSDLLDREEKLFADEVLAQLFLPLEGPPRAVAEHWVTVTAYSSEPRQTDATPFTTAWQTPVRDGVVALNFLPLGSLVRFPDNFGDKIFVVEDRMNVRYPFRADIWMLTTPEAKTFGLKYLRLEVLGARYPRDYVLEHFTGAFPGKK
ncbi:MAG: hypothetical protein Q8L21_00035 [Candidatus Komeilibacteria bacterium]|nr:hypothetical protein [Candidatus Komeilibacteria bacterium]